MIQINVALLNGNPELLTLLPSSTIRDVKDRGPTSFWEKVPQTYHCQESSPSRFWANLRRSRDRGRRVPYSSGTSTTTGSNRQCLCLVVSWRQRNRYLGSCRRMAVTVRQFKISSGCAADSSHMMRAFAAILEDGSVVTWGDAEVAGDSSAVRDQLKGVQQIQATFRAFAAILEDGSVVTWGDQRLGRWRQFGSSRSAQGCGTDSSHWFCLCCDSGRWIRRDLGWFRQWRWQFGSSRSAQGCAADSGHNERLCCDSGRWIRRYLGWCRHWRWQFGSWKISSRVCSRFKPQSQAFAAILEDGSVVTWGVAEISWRVTVQGKFCESSSGVCSIFKPPHKRVSRFKLWPLLRFWKMDPSLPGVMQTMAVTVRQFKISSRVCSRFKPQVTGICCDSGRWICRYLGWCTLWRWQFGSSRSAQGRAADSSHRDAFGAFAAILEDGSVVTWGDAKWRWQFGSSRGAQGRAADSSYQQGLCCYSWRWICCYLGWWRMGWWQFGSSRSAWWCLVQLCVCLAGVWRKSARWEFVQRRTNAGAAWAGTHWACAETAVVVFLMKLWSPKLKFVRLTRHTKNCASTHNLLWVIFNRYFQFWCLLIKIEALDVSDCFSMLLVSRFSNFCRSKWSPEARPM